MDPQITQVKLSNDRHYCKVAAGAQPATWGLWRRLADALKHDLVVHGWDTVGDETVGFTLSIPNTYRVVAELLRFFPTARKHFAETLAWPARLAQVEVKGGRIYFRISSGDDFEERLQDVRDAFSHRERHWNDKERLWDVPDTQENRQKLAEIFPNATGVFEEIDNQLPLF